MEKLNGLFEKVFDGFKKFTPALFAILLCTGIILFVPYNIASKVGLDALSDTWRTGLGILFVLSLTLITSIFGFNVYNTISKTLKKAKQYSQKKKLIDSLSNDQKQILQNLFENNEKRIALSESSGDAQYLINKGIIYRPQQFVELDEYGGAVFYYVPQPWLMDMYNKNPKILHDD